MMNASWLIWSVIPGLHWLTWILAGIRAKSPSYYVIGLAYALPCLAWLVFKRIPLAFLGWSWIIGLLHLYLTKHDIARRIARAQEALAPEPLRQALLQAALRHHGVLSVTLGVLETGRSFPEVERTLQDMVTSGYVYMRNHPSTGVVEYVFREFP